MQEKSTQLERGEHSTEILRINKRGKTLVLLLDEKVEVVLKFPTAKDLNGCVEMLEGEGVKYVGSGKVT